MNELLWIVFTNILFNPFNWFKWWNHFVNLININICWQYNNNVPTTYSWDTKRGNKNSLNPKLPFHQCQLFLSAWVHIYLFVDLAVFNWNYIITVFQHSSHFKNWWLSCIPIFLYLILRILSILKIHIFIHIHPTGWRVWKWQWNIKALQF